MKNLNRRKAYERIGTRTFVIMVKNEDDSFSPVGMNKEQANIINVFLCKLSEDAPLIIKEEDKYVQAT